LNEIETTVYNKGERLLPGITHGEGEQNRHLASYTFFLEKIKDDLSGDNNVTILDLGCGVGWGCELLSVIPNSVITGIDNSIDTLNYAKDKYSKPNIEYKLDDIIEFIPIMPEYNYVVSRGVFEHIATGIELINKVKFGNVFLFDVPYKEVMDVTKGIVNEHHLLTELTEKDFEHIPNIEFFYEDIDGVITKEIDKKPNMIMCVCRR